jgi:hypothetical protein
VTPTTLYAGGFGPGGAVVAIGSTAYTSEALVGDFAVGRWTKAGLPDAPFGTGGGTKMRIGSSDAVFGGVVSPGDRTTAAGWSRDDLTVARYLSH